MRSRSLVLIFSFVFLIIGIVLSLFVGAVDRLDSQVFWLLRFPRTLCGIAVGGGLAVAGALAQAVLCNPLADPFTIGIASAAALGVVVGSFFHWSFIEGLNISPGIFAFVFAMLSLFGLMLWLRKGFRKSADVLLAGVVAGLFFSSLGTLLSALSDPASWALNLTWMLGSISNLTASESFLVLVLNLLLFFLAWFHWKPLDLLSVDEVMAESAGVDLQRFRKRFFILLSLLTAICVSSAGVIGFIGLIIPHTLKRLGVTGHRMLLPLAFIAGAGLLLFSDVLSRKIIAPSELPVGVLMAIIGAPVFLVIAKKQSHET